MWSVGRRVAHAVQLHVALRRQAQKSARFDLDDAQLRVAPAHAHAAVVCTNNHTTHSVTPVRLAAAMHARVLQSARASAALLRAVRTRTLLVRAAAAAPVCVLSDSGLVHESGAPAHVFRVHDAAPSSTPSPLCRHQVIGWLLRNLV